MDTGINVYLNNSSRLVNSQASLTDLLNAVNITSHNGVALAVNNNVIPKTEWSAYKLSAEDKVTLIKATQGG